MVRYLINILDNQLENDTYVNSIVAATGITVPASTFGPVSYTHLTLPTNREV